MKQETLEIRRALISCSDKTGLEELGSALTGSGVEIISTGGTAKFLKERGLSVSRVEDLTGFPEILDGRVKTLHPKVFGGILGRRTDPAHQQQMKEHGIPAIDLVVVNLYPFRRYLKDTLTAQVEHVDIGGPAMLRASAKNFESVCVLSDPADYAEFLAHFRETNSRISFSVRKRLATRTFQRTSAYDAAIASAWTEEPLPTSLDLTPRSALRYGENPHQAGRWANASDAAWKLLHGKELSYNNLLDAEAAQRLTADFSDPAVAVIKHGTPCGVAAGKQPASELIRKALAADSLSAFGGIVSTNVSVDAEFAKAASSIFLELVIAPEFSPTALEVFAAKKNLRLVQWDKTANLNFEIRRSLGGWLVQEADQNGEMPRLETVTKTPLPKNCLSDLQLAWTVACHARSNAIVIAKDGVTVGIGAGQVSRVDAVEMALKKTGPKTSGAVLASDAFFPFRDSIDNLADSGIAAVIQPGGSVRDPEVIAACDEHGIAMAFTGRRGFRH